MGACTKVTLIVLCVVIAVPALAFGISAAIATSKSGGTLDMIIVTTITFVLFFVTIPGIWGSCAESRGMLIAFIIGISVCLLGSLATGGFIIASTQFADFDDSTLKTLDKSGILDNQIEKLEGEGECCHCSYKGNPLKPCKTGEWKKDCCHLLAAEIKKTLLGLGIAAVSLAALQIGCIVFAVMLCNEIANRPPPALLYVPAGPMPAQPPRVSPGPIAAGRPVPVGPMGGHMHLR